MCPFLMQKLPLKLHNKLEKRKLNNNLRSLKITSGLIDFCSNDYLGFSRSEELSNLISNKISQLDVKPNGATGSRLISGNSELVEKLEDKLACFFASESSLLFNTGYSANQGILSALPQRGDTIIYDELVHASIRDGMRLSFANRVPFTHNDLEDLEQKLKKESSDIYVVVESIYSMDGDICPLKKVIELCDKYGAYVIVDEAHSVGVLGNLGKGLCVAEGIENSVLARIYTFGKALGVHGACVVGSQSLIDYLVNFSRTFIYTTALPTHSIVAVDCALYYLQDTEELRQQLNDNIAYFQSKMQLVENDLRGSNMETIESYTAIQGVMIPGNTEARDKAIVLQKSGLDVRPILSPTVKTGTERLRICLHAFNTLEEMDLLINNLIK